MTPAEARLAESLSEALGCPCEVALGRDAEGADTIAVTCRPLIPLEYVTVSFTVGDAPDAA